MAVRGGGVDGGMGADGEEGGLSAQVKNPKFSNSHILNIYCCV